jgi:transposase InsO family protein
MLGHRASQDSRQVRGQKTRFTGYEYVHVAVDDHSRLAYAGVLEDLTAECAVAFLRRAVAWFAERGVHVQAVMSDNRSAYVAHDFRHCLQQLGLRHLRIKPGRARTNFIQTLLSEWAYAQIYGSSHERAVALPFFLRRYNFTRPHGSLGKQVPASRLNNLVGNYN